VKISPFDGNQAGYDPWKIRMEIQIKELGLMKLVDNSELTSDIKGFDQLDEKLYGLIVCSVSDSVLGN